MQPTPLPSDLTLESLRLILAAALAVRKARQGVQARAKEMKR